MKVPQMPLLFTTQHTVQLPMVRELVEKLEKTEEDGDPDAFNICIKPTHLSDGKGGLFLSKEKWMKSFNDRDQKMGGLLEHMEKYLAMRAGDTESEALKSITPGFIVQ